MACSRTYVGAGDHISRRAVFTLLRVAGVTPWGRHPAAMYAALRCRCAAGPATLYGGDERIICTPEGARRCRWAARSDDSSASRSASGCGLSGRWRSCSRSLTQGQRAFFHGQPQHQMQTRSRNPLITALRPPFDDRIRGQGVVRRDCRCACWLGHSERP
jgi:hypothetical protein